MCVVLGFGVIFTLYQSFGPAGVAGNIGLTSIAGATLCLAAWAVCCNYLWRCYQSGLQDVRNLYRQLKSLDTMSEKLTQIATADEPCSAEEHSTEPVTLEIPKRRANRESADDGVPSVVQLDTYRR